MQHLGMASTKGGFTLHMCITCMSYILSATILLRCHNLILGVSYPWDIQRPRFIRSVRYSRSQFEQGQGDGAWLALGLATRFRVVISLCTLVTLNDEL